MGHPSVGSVPGPSYKEIIITVHGKLCHAVYETKGRGCWVQSVVMNGNVVMINKVLGMMIMQKVCKKGDFVSF